MDVVCKKVYNNLFNFFNRMELFNYDYKYLTDEHIIGFEHYKYSSIDTSPLSLYVMHPFWDYIVKFFPIWIAPNLLTFVGFLFTVLNLLLFSFYDYGFYAASEDYPQYNLIPRWVFVLAAFNLFMAYTLDGIDGKQARRTKTSSPVGELFDHGLDSYSAVMIPLALFSLFGRNGVYSISPFRMFLVCWNVFLTFYLSHWEKYNTGILYLPWGYDLSMWSSIILFLFTGIFGQHLWKFYLFGFPGGIVFEFTLHISSIMANTPAAFYNIYFAYKNKTGKMLSFYESVRPLIPVAYFIAIVFIWVKCSPSNIIDRDPRAMFFLTGTIFSNICCHLIIAQMSNTRCEIFNPLLIPLSCAIFLNLTIFSKIPIIEILILYILCIFVLLSHIHYGTCVVRQMCKHFNLYCFKLKQLSTANHND